ncbi:protein translocase subunit SecD, partial [bacterium]|nr:protein translocase subunit SecD [bacterium]
MNQQNPAKLIVVLLALVASVYFLIPTYNYYSLPQEERELNPTQETKELQKKALNLGLDLQGGMHVSLEVNLLELMKTTANNSTLSSGLPSPEFQKFTSVLEEKSKGSDAEFFTLFGEAVSETGIQLATYYGDGDRGISNDEIIAKLKEEATSAIDQALAILRNRVDEFGVSEPIIQKQGDRRIVIELAGVKDKKAALSLIGSSALLEFKLVGDDAKIPDFLSKIDVKLAQNDFKFSAKATESDTASTSSNETSQGLTDFGKTQTDSAKTDSTKKDNLFEPEKNNLFSSLVAHNPGSSEIIVPNKDYAKVMEILSQSYVKEGLIRYEFLPYKREATATNDTPWRFILVNKTAELTGKYITDAAVSMNASTPIPVVSLEMDGEGSHIWARVTGNNINKRIAIALDGKIHSAPVVRSKITGGRSVIEGMGSIDEAKALAIVIKAGALPAPVDIIGLTTVGASLGKDTIEKGKMASYIGAILVVIAMIAAYRVMGVLACVSLGFTMLTIFALLSAFHATLTLPGIAGLALTIGMAVDANVLIYERIREEIDLGKTVHSAIQIGFEKSKSAIYDSNITTFLSGIILYTFGTGPVRGFALTLMVGIITSVFAALVVTRLLIEFVYKKKDTLNVGGVTFLNNKNINFLGYGKYGFIFSLVITFIGIGAVLFGGLNYGIEFKGGTVIEYNFDKDVNIEDVRASLKKVNYGNAEIQTFGDLKNIVIKIDTPEKLEETTQLLKNT